MSEYVSAKAAKRAAEERERKARKRYNITVAVITAVIVLLILFTVLFGSNLFYNTLPAIDIGGEKFTVTDFNYNYFSLYNSLYSSYGQMAQYIMPSGTSLRDAGYFGDSSKTWAEYLEEEALSRMQRVALLVSEAEKEGYTLPQEDADTIESNIESLKSQASANGFTSFKQYLNYCYGKGMNEKIFRENLRRDALASSYSAHKMDSFTFSDSDITSNYAENADDYDYYTYRLYKFSGEAVTDNADTDEDETVSAEDAMANAKSQADDFVAAVSSEQEYIDYAAGLNAETESYNGDTATLRTTQGSNLGADYKPWLTDAARQPGDVEAIKTPDDSTTPGYYVLYFVGRDNNQYDAVSGYYGLVYNSTDITEDSFDSHEAYVEALQAKAEADAQMVLDDYTGGSDLSYDGFVNVMTSSTDLVSEDGVMTSVGIHDVPDAVSQWLHSSDRKPGDTGLVYDETYGCFILYYTGTDGVYANLMSEAALKSDAYSTWETDGIGSFPVDTNWQMMLSKKITALGG